MISYNYNGYNINLLKRKNESEEEQINKFKKNNSKKEQFIQELVYSCFRSTPILQYLSHIDLLSFEQVAMNHSELTQQAWGKLRKKECHQLEWKMCSNEPNRDKWNYRLERALFRYVEIFSEVLNLEGSIVNGFSLKENDFSKNIIQLKQINHKNNLNKFPEESEEAQLV